MLEIPPKQISSAAYTQPPSIVCKIPNSNAITPDVAFATFSFGKNSLENASRERVASRAIEELQRYAQFRSGWDGYNGKPFRANLIGKGIDLIRLSVWLGKAQSVTITAIPGPASDGSIDIELRLGAKTLIVTMYPDDVNAEIYWENGDKSGDLVVPNELVALVPHVAWLAR
jgi:hypothetical protein